jgi:hypothetical protein
MTMPLGEVKLQTWDSKEIAPGVFAIGEPTPVTGTNKLRCLANIGEALVLVECTLKFMSEP